MSLRLWLANGIAMAGMGWLAVASGASGVEVGVARVVPRSVDASGLASLESRAATANSAGAVAALASAYLDHEQPGLAAAVIEHAPGEVRGTPEVAHLYARSLFHRGHVREALAVAREAAQGCGESACTAWVLAKTARQVAFLEQVVAAGIDDPARDPVATRAAYDRSSHEVRLVAMR